MVIIINMFTIENGVPSSVEYGRFEDDEITGKINVKGITREEVLYQFNRGYYRTSEAD